MLGVTYDTPPETLERIPGMVKEIVEKQEQARFDRAHFRSFGDSALEFETVYWVLSPDYTVYMDVQQAINFAILRDLPSGGNRVRVSDDDVRRAGLGRACVIRRPGEGKRGGAARILGSRLAGSAVESACHRGARSIHEVRFEA